jgi:hypothetical protein
VLPDQSAAVPLIWREHYTVLLQKLKSAIFDGCNPLKY